MEMVTDLEKYLPVVRNVAKGIHRRLPKQIDLDDLVSAGVIGLVSAAKKFNPRIGTNFRKYAEIRITGAILDEIRKMDTVSRSARQRQTDYERTKRKLEKELKRKPTEAEIAKQLGVDMEEFEHYQNKAKPVVTINFDDLGILRDQDKRDILQYIKDPVSVDPQVEAAYKSLKSEIATCIASLPEKQRVVLTLYYYEEMNLKEIGRMMGLTESRICQLRSKAIKDLKQHLKKRQIQSVKDTVYMAPF